MRDDLLAFPAKVTLPAFIHSLLHCFSASRGLAPGDMTAVRSDGSAAIVEPDHRFASLAIILTVLERHLLGLFLILPSMGVAVGAILLAIGDSAVDLAAPVGAVSTVRGAAGLGITAIADIHTRFRAPAPGGLHAVPVAIRPCVGCDKQKRRDQTYKNEVGEILRSFHTPYYTTAKVLAGSGNLWPNRGI